MLTLAAFALAALSALADEPVSKEPPRGKTFVVDISGEIDLGLTPYVERILSKTTADDLMLLHVNTFGGRIDAAVQIRDALLGAKAKTAAFVDARAISAGALISLATDTIIMSHGATIGAATPVQIEGVAVL